MLIMEKTVNKDTPVGTKVKIVANTSHSCNRVGDIGVITEQVHDGGNVYYCRVFVEDRVPAGNAHHYSDLELVEDSFSDTYEIC
jgi:RPA family protein